MLAKIIKVINSNTRVYYIEIYNFNMEYLETTYCRYKYEAKEYCNKINAKII